MPTLFDIRAGSTPPPVPEPAPCRPNSPKARRPNQVRGRRGRYRRGRRVRWPLLRRAGAAGPGGGEGGRGRGRAAPSRRERGKACSAVGFVPTQLVRRSIRVRSICTAPLYCRPFVCSLPLFVYRRLVLYCFDAIVRCDVRAQFSCSIYIVLYRSFSGQRERVPLLPALRRMPLPPSTSRAVPFPAPLTPLSPPTLLTPLSPHNRLHTRA